MPESCAPAPRCPHCPALEHLGHMPPYMPQPGCHFVHIPPVVYQAFKIESLGVIVAIALECALFASFIALPEWGATLCPLCVVDGQECPGLNASALTVLRMLSEMSATWCLNAEHCKQHGRILHTCLGPLLLLCSNLCGKETLYTYCV